MSFPMNIAVVAATRTAVGRGVKGTLRDTRPDEMAGVVLAEAVRRVPGLSPERVDDVVLGCAMPEAEQGLNMARQAVFLAGFPDTVAAQTVNRFCASGVQAIAIGAQAVHAGTCDVVVAGGAESMSMVPMSGNKVSLSPKLVESRPEAYIAMGNTAERVATRFKISREDQDAFGLASQQKAARAQAAGRFAEEIVALKARRFVDGRVEEVPFLVDECPRPETTLEGLAKLKPAFTAKGSVTAGTSSPLSDGAAAVVLASERVVSELGVTPLARMLSFVAVGVPPDIMGIGPLLAIKRLLDRCGLKMTDIALFEMNEAFASQALYCQRELGIPDEKLNVNGGAIALGHPLGCTGAKLTTQGIYEARRRGGGYVVVSMCIGGGMGAAALYRV